MIQSERLLLRSTEADDIDYVVQTESDEENSRFVMQWPREARYESFVVMSMLSHEYQRIGCVDK